MWAALRVRLVDALTPQSQPFARSRSRAAIATFGANAINTLIVGAQAIVLVPLYLHAIGAHLYGAWLGSGEVLVWMQAMDFGIPNLMIQRIARAYAKSDRSGAADWFAAGLLVLTLTSAVIGAVGVGLSFVLPSWLGVGSNEAGTLRAAFIVGTLASCATLVANGCVGLARAIQDTYFLSAALIGSAVAGFVTSLILILSGWGLWAIPAGLVARAAVGLCAALVFAVHAWHADFGVPFRIEPGIINELVSTSPITAIGGVSYTVMSQSEIVLVAVLGRPELAVVYALTRRAADLGRSFVDMIGFASYGGVAHLISSVDGAVARSTYDRLRTLHLSCSVAVGAAYLAVNNSLLDVWVGRSVSGGTWLIFLMSIQSIVLGHSYLINLLYRATGKVPEGSFALLLEALVRVPLLAMLFLVMGLPGLPIASTATALSSAILVHRRILRILGAGHEELQARAIWGVRALIIGLAAILAVVFVVPRWSYVLIVGSAIALSGGTALIYLDPRLRPLLGVAAN